MKNKARDDFESLWLAEERVACMDGWDFSYLEGRCREEGPPWDYRAEIQKYLTPEKMLLDIDTGGGEFLLSLHHPYHKTCATEGYAPNVELCRRELCPLEIEFREADGKGRLPFSDGAFDLVINRHGDFNAEEIFRVLKPGGIVVTQQVGAQNDRELVALLMGETELPFPEQTLAGIREKFRSAGFSTVLRAEESFSSIRFYDVGALVWFARIIEWEFPGFSVKTHLSNLRKAQEILEKRGFLEGSAHRILLSVQKPRNKEEETNA